MGVIWAMNTAGEMLFFGVLFLDDADVGSFSVHYVESTWH